MLFAVAALAYLPGNWSDRHANDDFARSDAVLIGRVIAVNRTQDSLPAAANTAVAFTYTASIIAANVFYGSILTNQVLTIPIGGYMQDIIDESEPTWVSQHNTQRGFDLNINHVYLLALSRIVDKSGQTNWVPRSGHRSVYEIRRAKDLIMIRKPSALNRYLDLEANDIRDFVTNAIPLHDFISTFITSPGQPYPDTGFWDTIPIEDDNADDIHIEY